jgi:hypothetical protein
MLPHHYIPIIGSNNGASGGGGGAPPAWLLSGASFGFDFTEDETWDGSATGTPSSYLTCSRASGKWLRFNSAPYYRFIDVDVLPLSDLGLLVEDQATNLVLNSEDFTSTTYWGQSNLASITKDQTGPDGVANSACLVTENTATARHGINEVVGNPVAVSVSSVTLGSVIAKAGTCGIIQLTYPLATFSGGGYANFDLTNGVAGSTGGTLSGSGMQALGDGWYRCWISATCTNAGNTNLNVNLCTATNNTRNFSFLGTSRNFLLFGLDVVLGTTGISSHITTGLATATRMADVITLTGDAETAALAAKATFVKTNFARFNGRFVNYNDSRRVEGVSSTTCRASNATNTATATVGSGAFNTGVVKSAFGHDAAGLSAVANGGSVATNANAWGSVSAPVTIGTDTTGVTNIRGWLQQIMWSNTKDQFNGDTTP